MKRRKKKGNKVENQLLPLYNQLPIGNKFVTSGINPIVQLTGIKVIDQAGITTKVLFTSNLNQF